MMFFTKIYIKLKRWYDKMMYTLNIKKDDSRSDSDDYFEYNNICFSTQAYKSEM